MEEWLVYSVISWKSFLISISRKAIHYFLYAIQVHNTDFFKVGNVDDLQSLDVLSSDSALFAVDIIIAIMLREAIVLYSGFRRLGAFVNIDLYNWVSSSSMSLLNTVLISTSLGEPRCQAFSFTLAYAIRRGATICCYFLAYSSGSGFGLRYQV